LEPFGPASTAPSAAVVTSVCAGVHKKGIKVMKEACKEVLMRSIPVFPAIKLASLLALGFSNSVLN
jgi:hypothetical protein